MMRAVEPGRITCNELHNDHEALEIDADTGDSHWRDDSLDCRWVIRSLIDKTPNRSKPVRGAAAPRTAGNPVPGHSA